MYESRLEVHTEPRATSGWGVPKRFRGASLKGSEWCTPDVTQWVVDATQGRIIKVSGPTSHVGLTVIGDEGNCEEFFSGLLSDLVRQPNTQLKFDHSFCKFATAQELHSDFRLSYDDAKEYWGAPPLLVVPTIAAAEKWQLNTLADVIRIRGERGHATMVGMTRAAYKGLYPAGEDPSTSSSLASVLAYKNFEVELT